MWWLWFIGPIAVVVVYVLTGFAKDDKERRVLAAGSWRTGPGGNAKIVRRLPPELRQALEDAGGGTPVVIYELFPKIAYLAVMSSDMVSGSDHQTIVGLLDGDPLTFVARPLPVLDGKRIANSGVLFPKDEDFMAEFLVEGEDAARIKKWLPRSLRSALLDLPAGWLRVRGKTMALTVYGSADEDQIDDLVIAADAIFADHGADGGPSLLGAEGEMAHDSAVSYRDPPVGAQADNDEDGDSDDEPVKAKAPIKKADPAKKPTPAKIAKAGGPKKALSPKAKTTAAK